MVGVTHEAAVKSCCIWLIMAAGGFWTLEGHSQAITAADYEHAQSFLSATVNPLVYNDDVRPRWLEDDRFWYANITRSGTQYVLIDPTGASRAPLFDHEGMAASLSRVLEMDIESQGLPRLVRYSDGMLTFDEYGERVVCDAEELTCALAQSSSETVPYSTKSPDGRHAAFIRDHNLWVRHLATGTEIQLTTDGEEGYGYATNNAGWVRSRRPVLLWSPDSQKIATFQHDGRGVGEMYTVSTRVGHPQLDRWRYPLVGDSLIFRIARVVVHLEGPHVVRLDMPADPHRSTTTDHVANWQGQFLDVQWSPDSEALAFISSSRDHKNATLRLADAASGSVREVLAEHAPTYYESGIDAENWRVLFGSDEVLWFSERDDWGHLYLYDLKSGALKDRVTEGEWAVQQVVRLDDESRYVYFNAGGRDGPDPYYHSLYRVHLDSGAVALLTPETAHHTASFSPSGRFFVDRFSTPSVPPTAVVRRGDGTYVMELETADIADLEAAGWQPPQSVVVKARDGQTDLYGLLYNPTRLDSTRSYPILNYIYPGPQSGSVGSRSFRAARGDKQAVAELGFVVVEVDAMGTPGRSKSFHDAYYGQMGDNGIPDQITAIQQLAASRPWMDLERVGIWGHSGGGFASTGAILRFPDFYKVAVSGAGNHDNRNYEDDWGEKWHGLLETYPDGTTNYDSQANHLLAANLEGKLLLAHGMLDDNVPASNTLLMVDALIKANKDFDLVIFPNANHGLFPARTYWMRKRWDYFVRHLHGTEPPKEFAFN